MCYFEEDTCGLRHLGLKSLELVHLQDFDMCHTCPSLEYLHIEGEDVKPKFLANLNSSCRNLKKVHLNIALYDGEEEDEGVKIIHETLEELDVAIIYPANQPLVHIACPQLTKLVMREESFWERDLDSLSLANLTRLQLIDCAYVRRSPSILSILPRLEFLQIVGISNEVDMWTQIEKERSLHPNLVMENVVRDHDDG